MCGCIVDHATSLLIASGIAPNNTVALTSPNTVEFIVMFLAVIGCQATAAPLNAAYTAEEFEFYLSDSESKLLIMQKEPIHAAQAAASKLNIPHVQWRSFPSSEIKPRSVVPPFWSCQN